MTFNPMSLKQDPLYNGSAADSATTDPVPASLSVAPEAPAADLVEVALEDWDLLFAAVTARLRKVASSQAPPCPSSAAAFACGDLPTELLECADALDQLRATMTHELTHRQQFDAGAVEARAETLRETHTAGARRFPRPV